MDLQDGPELLEGASLHSLGSPIRCALVPARSEAIGCVPQTRHFNSKKVGEPD